MLEDQTVGIDRFPFGYSWAKYPATDLSVHHALHIREFGWNRFGLHLPDTAPGCDVVANDNLAGHQIITG